MQVWKQAESRSGTLKLPFLQPSILTALPGGVSSLMTVHHSAADSLLWLCLVASKGSRSWVSPVTAWCPWHPACTWDSPDTAHTSSPGAGIWIGIAKLIPKAGLVLLSKLDSPACKWEPAGSECMHRSDGGYKAGNPLNSLVVFPSSLDAPHWALPGWSGTVETGCAGPTHLQWCMEGALTPTTSVPNIKYWLQPAGLGQTARRFLQKWIHGKPHCMVSTWLSLVPWHCKRPMGFSLSPPKHCW